MGISDFGQVGRLLSKCFQKDVRLPKGGEDRLKVAESLIADRFQRWALAVRSIAVCDEKSYEMNKYLSLVYLTTNWRTEGFACDLPPVARKAREKPNCTVAINIEALLICLQQLRDRFRRVLQVSIHRDCDIAGNTAKPQPPCLLAIHALHVYESSNNSRVSRSKNRDAGRTPRSKPYEICERSPVSKDHHSRTLRKMGRSSFLRRLPSSGFPERHPPAFLEYSRNFHRPRRRFDADHPECRPAPPVFDEAIRERFRAH